MGFNAVILVLVWLSTEGMTDATEVLSWLVLVYPLNVILGNIKIIHTLNYSDHGAVWFGVRGLVTTIVGMISALQLYFTDYAFVSGVVFISQLILLFSVATCFYFGKSERMEKLLGETED